MTDASTSSTSAPPPTEPTAPTGSQAPVQLRGWWLALAWAGLLAFGAAGLWLALHFASGAWAVATRAEPALSQVHLSMGWPGDLVVTPQRGGVAARAGLPRGRLVRIDGASVPDGGTALDHGRLLAGPPGTAVRLGIVGADGDTVTATVTRTAAPSPELRATGLTVRQHLGASMALKGLFSLGFFLAAVVLAVRMPRHPFALACAAGLSAFAVWEGLPQLSPWPAEGPVADGHFLVGPLLLFYALATLPDGRPATRWGWAALGAAVIAVLSRYVAPESVTASVAVWVVTGLVVAAQAARYRRRETAVERQQTKWAVLGIALGLAAAVLTSIAMVLFPRVPGTAWFWWGEWVLSVPFLGFLAVPAGIVLSLLRYRLWDAEAAWSRTAMAAALTLVLTAIVAGGTAFAQTALGAGGTLSLALATAAAALVFVPLQRRLSDWADHRFLRDLTDLKEKLPDLVAHLRETESVEGIAEAVTDRVAPAVHATHVALVVPEADGWRTVGTEGTDRASADAWAESAGLSSPPEMAPGRRQPWRAVVWRDASDPAFPVRVALRAERGSGEVATEGWLLLGPRPDGSGYGPDDLEAVAAIAGPVGRALRVVRAREARAAALTALTADVGRLRAELAAAVREIRAALGPDAEPAP